MLDTTPISARPTHAPADHPAVPAEKVGILLANLGTPDNYDYWSMRRYLNEFLSDRRVIDYSPWIWQPLLQLIILSKRPFSSGAPSAMRMPISGVREATMWLLTA